MTLKNKLLFLVPILLLVAQCAKGLSSTGPVPVDEKTSYNLTIDLFKTHQTIDNFGASDAWSCQFVGLWPTEKKNEIADLLFSKEFTAQGQPKGIGLSQWRFNIGAGSAHTQTIKDDWRSAESFLTEDGTYDWEKQAGQVWFLEAAKKRGVEQYLAFPNSAPIQLTKNGKASASSGASNLAASKFDDYADYLTTILKGIAARTGVTFDFISPVNEPQWEWSDDSQEGSPYTNTEISGIVRALNQSLEKEKLTTKIVVAEAGQYEFMYSDYDKPGQGKQVDAFFKPGSETFIGDLSHVEPIISAHSYFTSSPLARAISIRKQVADKVGQVNGLRFWQSEYCILGDNNGEIEGHKRDLGINSALYVARTIHQDLVTANASAWQWWLAISPYDYKDGLIYIDQDKTDGNFYPSKILWALGNYSRFIRPGAVRVEVNAGDKPKDSLSVSSYRSEKELITVIVNEGHQSIDLNLSVVNGKLGSKSRSFLTSESVDLAPEILGDLSRGIAIKARSITTLISEIL